MGILDLSWFVVSFLIIGVVILVDPKSSVAGAGGNQVAKLFASPSTGQKFIYKFSATLITLFFILSI